MPEPSWLDRHHFRDFLLCRTYISLYLNVALAQYHHIYVGTRSDVRAVIRTSQQISLFMSHDDGQLQLQIKVSSLTSLSAFRTSWFLASISLSRDINIPALS